MLFEVDVNVICCIFREAESYFLYYTKSFPANLPNRYSVLCWRPVTHAQTWASYSALYRFGRLFLVSWSLVFFCLLPCLSGCTRKLVDVFSVNFWVGGVGLGLRNCWVYLAIFPCDLDSDITLYSINRYMLILMWSHLQPPYLLR